MDHQGSNKTQILHRLRPKKFVLNQPPEDNFREERFQQDEEIFNPQDDLYTKTWETNVSEQLATRGNEPIPSSLPKGEQPVTSNSDSSDARENEVDYIIVNDSPNAVSDAAHKRNERLNDDVSKRDEASKAARDENADWPNPAVYLKNQENKLADLSGQEIVPIVSEGISTDENDA